MNSGDTVYSLFYRHKGDATILSFSYLFGELYAEILFIGTGERITTPKSDLVMAESLAGQMHSGQTDAVEMFLVRNMVLRLRAVRSGHRLISSANYKIKPLPHQLLTVNFVMRRHQPRCLIADEVGLGKTIEAILVFQEYKLRNMARRVLIVVPSGLILQWQEELRVKFGETFVVYTMEQIKALKQSHGEQTNVWILHDKIIASIDTIKPLRVHDGLDQAERQRRVQHNEQVCQAAVEAGFDMVIIDEAHRLTRKSDGSQSARFRFGEMISRGVPIFLLLTATPHQGDTAMFHSLMKLVDPVLFASRDALNPDNVAEVTVRNKKRAVVDFDGRRIFKQRITSLVGIAWEPGQHDREQELYLLVTEYAGRHFRLALQANDQMLILLVMLYQRILASSSFALRATMQRRLDFLLDGESNASPGQEGGLDDLDHEEDREALENQFGQAVTARISADPRELETEIRFVRECLARAEVLCRVYADAKLKKLIEIIDEIRHRENDPGLKFIVFTEFRATQEAICEYLGRFGYSSARIHGSLSREQKAEQVRQFREERQFLVSTDAGGEGINLQFCHCVINYDLPWNPARLEQRIGRVDRIGQENTVLVFNLYMAGTVEDHVRATLEAKLGVIKDQYGADKFADVLSALQEEFDFDRIYLEALLAEEKHGKALDQMAEEISRRARQIIDADDLLIPFSRFEDDPKSLYNADLQKIIRVLLFQFLKLREIPVRPYRNRPELFSFANPFPASHYPAAGSVIRNATLSSEVAFHDPQAALINLEHPVVSAILNHVHATRSGCLAACRLAINKFVGTSGFWFVYELSISNNEGKTQHNLVSVFLEDVDFENARIAAYLLETVPDQARIIPNFTPLSDMAIMEQAAQAAAQEKSRDVFMATRLRWLEELDIMDRRANEYFRIRENALNAVVLENIRESKRKQLKQDMLRHEETTRLARNIVPTLKLQQIAWLEFV